MAVELPAEQFLMDAGLVHNHSRPRAELLRCLGCRLMRGQGLDLETAAYCRDLLPRTLGDMLRGMEHQGLLTSRPFRRPGTAGFASRSYETADTPLGRGLRDALEPVMDCRTERGRRGTAP